MDINKILDNIKEWFSRTGRKIKKFFKSYKKMLVKQTKAGDYSILACTVLGLIAIILVIILVCSLISGSGKNKKKETPTQTSENTVSTPTDSDATPNDSNPDLTANAKTIYAANKDFLILVNSENPLADDYTFTHHKLNCGYDVDERIYTELATMLNDCNTAGHEYNIVSAYRSKETQQQLYNENLQKYIDRGYTAEQAEQIASSEMQKPGYSEHATGLALDIVALGETTLSTDLSKDETYKWLAANCQNYGFIVRYPSDKSEYTGISSEPWHFRYVGKDAAMFMYNNNLCLEEFIKLVNQ